MKQLQQAKTKLNDKHESKYEEYGEEKGSSYLEQQRVQNKENNGNKRFIKLGNILLQEQK